MLMCHTAGLVYPGVINKANTKVPLDQYEQRRGLNRDSYHRDSTKEKQYTLVTITPKRDIPLSHQLKAKDESWGEWLCKGYTVTPY